MRVVRMLLCFISVSALGACFSPAHAFSLFGSREQIPPAIEQLFRVAKSFRHTPDVYGDRWQTADETEKKRSGDCEDKAFWIFTRLKERGFSNVRLFIGKYRLVDPHFHVWVTCQDSSGHTYLVDPSIQDRVWYVSDFRPGFYIYERDFMQKTLGPQGAPGMSVPPVGNRR
jgi:hypothetical protein